MKDINKNKDRYYRTTNFYTAAFLFSKGIELVNISPTEIAGRSQFVFIEVPEREVLVTAFNFAKENSPETLIDVRKFVIAIKMLKDKLYQNKF